MSRSFSTAARTLLHFIWKGTDAVSKYETMISNKVAQNSKLKGADKVEIGWVIPLAQSHLADYS